MSKAILVIDMPKSCHGCPCAHSESDICQATKGWVFSDAKEIPCPLKPMPQKKNTEIRLNSMNDWLEHSERVGFNNCIDELVGDEE